MVALLALLSVAGFVVNRRLVADQERRLLQERATEAGVALTGNVRQTATALELLGAAYRAINRPGHGFTGASQSLLRAPVVAVGVAEADGDSVVARGGAGDVPPSGSRLEAERAALARRALAARDLVSGIIRDAAGAPILVLAVGTDDGLVIFEESRIDPGNPPTQAGAPFSELDVALYRVPEPTPDQLVSTTTGRVPSGRHLGRRVTPVGAEQWLVVASSRHSLVGSLTASVPWFFLAGGVIGTLATVAVVLSLIRWRRYALQLIEERTAVLRRGVEELQAAQFAAETANRAKSEFLSRMSHELRTPLNAVLGFAQLLELQPLPDDDQECVSQILKGGNHLLQLINEVLDISRIETGDLALSPEPVLVSDLLSEACDLIQPLALQQNVHLVGDDQRTCDVYVFADRQRLKQVLLNLLSNAVKYNQPGGAVSLSCAHSSPDRLRITVADTGRGIPAEQLGLLFVPFERLGAERTGVDGTGIGLAISQRLAEAMGGSIVVESMVGRGSSFIVDLPVVEGPVERYERLNGNDRNPQVVSAAPTAERRKVLHIEDNLANLKLVERLVENQNDIDIIPAMQGRLGVELARKHRPVLILLDLHLPDVSGETVLQQLRDDPATATIPVAIVSADATPGRVQRLLASGAIAYLTKPFDVRELLALLHPTSYRPDGA
jgi:signal transduction histidine kinase/ActR/RegA family two-component response regulator